MKKDEQVKQQLKDIRTAFNHVWHRFDNFRCPVCGAGKWTINDGVKFLMHYPLDETAQMNGRKATGEMVIDVYCRNCGYTMIFNVGAAAATQMPVMDDVIDQATVNHENYMPSMTPYEERKVKETVAESEDTIAKSERLLKISDEMIKVMEDKRLTKEHRDTRLAELRAERDKLEL